MKMLMQLRYILLLILCFCVCFCWDSSGLQAQVRDDAAWSFEYQREEIAPKFWKDNKIITSGETALAVSGNGLISAYGTWVQTEKIKPEAWYRFETQFLPVNVEEPHRCIFARIIWQDDKGEKINQAEYPALLREKTSEGWRIIRQIYQSPPKAVNAKIELIYRWDTDGTVYFARTHIEEVAKPKPRLVRLASIHHIPRGGKSPQENLDQFAGFLAQAAAKKPDIVCLPEGITVAGTGLKYVDVSESIPGPSTELLGALAKKYGFYIVAGIYEREGKTVYNTAILMGRDGSLKGKYRKVCIPREEYEGGITAGDSFPVFDTDFGRIGIMICWDVFFPEPARMLALKGAEVILLPIWGGYLTLGRARAIENQIYLVSSTYDTNMKTAIFDREGKILAEGSDANPIIVVEVDLNQQTLLPWLGDFRNRIPREMPPGKSLELDWKIEK